MIYYLVLLLHSLKPISQLLQNQLFGMFFQVFESFKVLSSLPNYLL